MLKCGGSFIRLSPKHLHFLPSVSGTWGTRPWALKLTANVGGFLQIWTRNLSSLTWSPLTSLFLRLHRSIGLLGAILSSGTFLTVFMYLFTCCWERRNKNFPQKAWRRSWRCCCHGHACDSAGHDGRGENHPTWTGIEQGQWEKLQMALSHSLFPFCKEQLKTTPGKPGKELNFYLILKIWSVCVSFNAHMQFMLWGRTTKHFGPKLCPGHAQFSSMVAHLESLHINISVAKSRIWSFISSNEMRLREFRWADGLFSHSVLLYQYRGWGILSMK